MSDDKEEKEKKGVAFEGQVDLATLQGHLQNLLAGFKKGVIFIQNGADVVELHPEPLMTIGLAARSKKDKQSLKLEIKWEKALPEAASTSALTISVKEPEPILVEEEDA